MERNAIARMASSAIAPTAIQIGSTQVVVVVRVVSVGTVVLEVEVVVLVCDPLLCLGALVCGEVEPLCANTCTAQGTTSRLMASNRLPAKRQRFCLYIIQDSPFHSI